MPLPPPRKPRTPLPAPEEAAPAEDASQTLDPAERRRILREQTLRGMKQGNLAMNLPPPVSGNSFTEQFVPKEDPSRIPWGKIFLFLPIMVAIIGLLLFVGMVDPSELENHQDNKLRAICAFARIAPPPEKARDVMISDPSESAAGKYTLRFGAFETEIRAWMTQCPGLQGLEPAKQPMKEVYTIIPPPGDRTTRKAVVTFDKAKDTIEISVDGFQTSKQESNSAYAARRRLEEKQKRLSQIEADAEKTAPPVPEKSPIASEFPDSLYGGPPPAAKLDPEAAARKARELEVLRLLSKKTPTNGISSPKTPSPTPAPATLPAPKPRIVE